MSAVGITEVKQVQDKIIDDRLVFNKSAISMHCFLEHKNKFSMEYFKLEIVKKDPLIVTVKPNGF